MKQRKIISLPSNPSKIYKQILAFMNFMLNLTPQERDVLAEIIKLDNEYSMLPEDKRAKFILDDNNILHPELRYKPDQEGFKIEINFVMTSVQSPVAQPIEEPSFNTKLETEMVKQAIDIPLPATATPPVEYQHDAAKAPVLEEEEFDITIELPDE